jgi:rhodanese-related sulfurtransferase
VLSPKSAGKADQLGYTNVKVYHDGMPVWKKGKHSVYSTVTSMQTSNKKEIPYVLVDVRDSSAAAGGVIPGAVSLPLGQLQGAKAQFPKQKGAPVIVYAASEAEAVKAFGTVRGWGYKNASILEGGMDAWVNAGNGLDPKAREKIAYVPKPRPGEFAVGEFRKLADSGSAEAVILDVRGTDETSAGMLKSAVNIPLTELTERMVELPKGKNIVAQCNTGAQAEMAYNLLTEAGYKTSWLNAKITIKPDGSYEIVKD